MLRLSPRKTHIIPHSLAIFSAVLLFASSQAENTGLDISRQLEPQQTVVAKVCDKVADKTAKVISHSSMTFLHLF